MSSVHQSTTPQWYGSAMHFERMQAADLPDVLHIESAVYPFPWTQGNFIDSLNSGYDMWVVRDATDRLAGYFLMMQVVDEAHLLNITVRADLHGQGLGRAMLGKVVELAHAKGLASVLLEVRPSNHRALAVYIRYGFKAIGVRKSYYPAPYNTREDAIVMRLPI